MVKRQPKPLSQLVLNLPHLSAVFGHGLACFGSRQFSGGAVFISSTQKQDFIAACTLITGIKVGRQLTAHKIAEVLDPVDVGDG